MAKKNDELLKKLLATFRVEADERLKAMSAGLLACEKLPDGEERAATIEQVFREVHSLKGAARAVNLTHVESFCQSLESVFAALKGKRLAVSPPLLDLLHQAVGALGGLLAADASSAHPPVVTALMRRLDDALNGTAAAVPASPPPPISPPPSETRAVPAAGVAPHPVTAPASTTVRVSTAKLDALMRRVEELLTPRLATDQRARELRETGAMLVEWKKQRARIQPTLRFLERSLERGIGTGGTQGSLDLLEYLESEQLHMKMLEDRLGRLTRSAERDRRMLAGMTDGLLGDVKEMQLLPFASLLEIFPRVVRELARDQGKEAELVVRGGEIEIDRRILEEMKDPLLHLLRNGVDHGIEQPATRERKNKPPRGTITLAISQTDSGKVEIVMTDDGAGIDAERVKASARKLGMLSAEEAERLGEPEALVFAFRSGVTTSPIITDVSGRGLGLAIVREKVERLGGTVTLDTHPDAGTAFRLTLPLTLATFRGVLARIGERLYVIPAAGVERVTRVASGDVRTVENRETIALGGRAASLVWMSDVLELPRPRAADPPADGVPLVVLGSEPARIAFRVDEVLGEQEVLVKSLGRQLARVRNVAGACVLGTGQVVPVLNVSDLLKSAVLHPSVPSPPATAAGKPAAVAKHSILVVEDSITSRSLLKNVLEAAGYRVATAVDGLDAYTVLKTEAFDLVVSDVDMPRMNGFDLTVRVRADKHLAELPVVLVTSLESREHRERGIDAGANAYIVKSSFDQSNLLEIVQRLI